MAKIDKELFAQNNEVMRRTFRMETSEMHAVGALMFTVQGKLADQKHIEECNKILRNRKGMFSEFRDNMRLPVLVKMALAEDPTAYLDGISDSYEHLSADFVFGSEERVLAAIILYDAVGSGKVPEMAARTMEIYKKIRHTHPMITSQADLAFAVLMATAEGDVYERLDMVEDCYKKLAANFAFSKDALQTSSHILSVDNGQPVDAKVEKFMELYKTFKKNGAKISGQFLVIFAILVNANIPVDAALSETREYETFLKTQKGFGVFGVSGQSRRIVAAAMAAADNMSNADPATSTLASMMLTIVLEIEMLIMICTINAAATMAAH